MNQHPESVECTCCGWQGQHFLPAGRHARANRRCPACNSLERHRLVARGLARCLHEWPALVMMEVGPQGCFAALARTHPRSRFFTVDVERPADVRADVTALPLPDGSVDVALCFHVLEHVSDDGTALRELRRVLSPGGLLVVQVPERLGPTLDGRDWEPSERARVLGHPDHLRLYGTEAFQDRLRRSGLSARPWPRAGDLSDEFARRAGLRSGQVVHLCVRDVDGPSDLLNRFICVDRLRG